MIILKLLGELLVQIGGEICCDDYHPHKYPCISFDTREGAIYERLIQEVRRYKVLFNKYQEITKEATREN